MPDPEGPTRFLVQVGYEFTAASEAEAYERTEGYVRRYNEAAAARGSDVRLRIGPGGPAGVTAIEGQLTAAERERVAAAEGSR